MTNTREIASKILQHIYLHNDFEKACEKNQNFNSLEQRDRSFVRLIVLESLRRNRQLDFIIKLFLKKPIDKNKIFLEFLLRISVCQILFLKVSEYAVVNSAVEISKKFNLQGLINAILRNVCRQKKELLSKIYDISNIPNWLEKNLSKSYGINELKKISKIITQEPELDIKIKNKYIKSKDWETILDGKFIDTDIIRVKNKGRINNLPFFKDGLWWVQGISSSLPVKCLKSLYGSNKLNSKMILEIGAAPGGKTAQLLDYGFKTKSIDISAIRTDKLKENLNRLNYNTDLKCLDFLDYSDEIIYDAVLLDAPCTASGLMQKKPEILIKNKTEDLESLIKKQRKLLEKSSRHLKNGGYLVYCVCSIFSKEGREQIENFLKKYKNFSLVTPDNEIQKYGKLLNNSMLLITPKQNYFTENIVGTIDGFFIAILKKEYE